MTSIINQSSIRQSAIRFLLLLLPVLCGMRADAQKNKPMADALARMAVADQQAAGIPPEGIIFGTPEWKRFRDSIFAANYSRISQMFSLAGYPGYDRVGEEGSHNFWMMVQHCDSWPEFQKEVLVEMGKEVNRNNAAPADYAYLVDRVKINAGQKQVYGTQLTFNTDSCQALPKPLENPEQVNARRKALGMPPLELYLNQAGQGHYYMNKEFYEKKGIKAPKLYVVPQ